MNEHVNSALFVYVPETVDFCGQLLGNPFQVTVTCLAMHYDFRVGA